MAIMNFVGIERKEQSVFITQSGTYRFKIVKHEVDGYTSEGNEKHKYTFEANKIGLEDGKPSLGTEVHTNSGTYNGDEKQSWVFMNLADALKIQTSFDPISLVGYYFIADVEMKKGNNTDKLFPNINPYSYKYSKMNDELPKVPESKEVKEPEPETYAPSLGAEAEDLF